MTFTGLYCDKDINECLTDPCKNNGTCLNFDGGYNCSCSYGYKGKNCEIPKCDLVNCKNGATCAVDNKKWQCNCVKYYFGKLGINKLMIFITHFFYAIQGENVALFLFGTQ
jgi:hypothetical protein